MEFEEFLPEDAEEDNELNLVDSVEKDAKDRIGQAQVYDIIVSKKPDWQTIIYELIASEQLDPWDIDIVVLTQAYFKRILEMENELGTDETDNATDFYISSKVLLAAALLLRIKSEFLLNKHIKSIDEILFGKKQDNKYIMERIEIDENELPVLIPKTPMSRLKRVTLQELMSALNRAIETETRRIKKEVAIKRAKKLSEVDFPTFKRIDLKDRIKQFYARILTIIKKINAEEKISGKHVNRIGFCALTGAEKEEKLACFLPLLHLSNNQKLWLEQENHLGEIWIYLYDYFDNNRNMFIEVIAEMEEIENLIDEKINEEEEIKTKSGLDIAREKAEEKRRLAEEARKELEKELGWSVDKIEESVLKGLNDEISENSKN